MSSLTNQPALTSETLLNMIRQRYSSLPVEDAFLVPAWFIDQRTWIQDPYRSNSAAYNIPLFLDIEGYLNLEVLQSALHELQSRHQPLRSIFDLNPELIQIVLSSRRIDIAVTVLHGNKPGAKNAEFQEICRGEVGRAFDLAEEPALRAHLVQFREDQHALLLTTHHLVCDDWSTGLLLRELFLIYEALSDPASKILPERGAFQYTDFIRWYQGQLHGEHVAAQLSFWKRELKDGGDFHHLEPDRPRPDYRTYCGASVAEMIPQRLLNSLQELSRRERVSVFMALLTGFQCTLHRCSGDDDVAVGSCTANRMLTEAEQVVGHFTNDLVLRTNLSGNPTFREALCRVRTRALTAYSYQDLPFGELVEAIEPRVSPGRNPLFQTMFILQDAPKEKLQCRSLTITRLPFHSQTAKYDLAVYMQPEASGLAARLEYNTDLFDGITARQLLWDYRETLEEMVRHPDAKINQQREQGRPAAPTAPAHQVLQTQPTVSSQALEAQLLKLWQDCFHTEKIDIDDDFFALGGSSLRAARLFAKVEQSFGVRIPIVALVESPTIRQFARLLRESKPTDVLSSVVEIQRGGFRPPLFCAHGQSGNLLFYRSLAEHLGPDQPVYGLQPRGMDGKQAPLSSIEEMASLYVEEIRRVQRNGPYFVAGYCMGGLVALEIAQQLKRNVQSVGMVALLDSYDAHEVQQTVFSDLQFAIQKAWFGLCHFLRTDSLNRRNLLHRRLDEFGSLNSAVFEANERAAFAYVPKRYPGPLLNVIPGHQYAIYRKPQLGWGELAGDGVESLVLPIYPGQMFEDPSISILASKLRAYMDKSSQKKIA